MYQFFESICVKNGLVYNLNHHQNRVDKTLKAFDHSNLMLPIFDIVKTITIPTDGLYKLRISYDLTGNYQFKILPYQYKIISSFALIDTKGNNYQFKFENRDWIDAALKSSGSAEIIMHHDGLIKDSSYANIVFYDGIDWFTPASPLLEGTQRAKLIQEGLIHPKPLFIKDLKKYKKFKCINAMVNWEDSIEYDVSQID